MFGSFDQDSQGAEAANVRTRILQLREDGTASLTTVGARSEAGL